MVKPSPQPVWVGIAKELVKGINSQVTRKGKQKIEIESLCDFGILGAITPLELVDI